jgi:polysaccharide biosynthesis protein PslG
MNRFFTRVGLAASGLLLGAVLVGIVAGVGLQPAIPDTPRNALCANFFLQQEVEPWKKEKTLQMAEDAGIGWAKQEFPWEEIQPRRGQYTWQKYDELVALYEQHHLQIIARLDRPPNWTKADPRFKQGPPDDPADFGEFVAAFITHFRGRVRYIQIWNEPNLLSEWGGRAPNPAEYLRLLQVAFVRARQTDPEVRVLSAPLAPTLEDSGIATNDLLYLSRLYQLGAGQYFDILSANAFGQDLTADDPPNPAVLNFRRVELERNIMALASDTGKAVWINEYGWNASPAYFKTRGDTLIWQRVTEEEQVAYTVRGIQKARSDWPWAGPLCIWYFRQVGASSPERSDYYFRMVDPDFAVRPLYEAIKALAGK